MTAFAPSSFTVRDFKVGDRIELHPATDNWMRGLRYGTVTRVGNRYVTLVMDAGGPESKCAPENIGRIL